jgi:hypothetical protein
MALRLLLPTIVVIVAGEEVVGCADNIRGKLYTNGVG